ncbi:MAG: preprotein translocase subunit SecG [Salinivirgaceae bacterium]|nr:preprotein translocase subunit SecG [Salinivirgaceae bacterium]MDD4746662.1 preprotein translocase subunit SecG [Salinivirgaceae bacterium]MDY0279549.1 preprotein translocase subunit SecG [Salinivirgaceae bacterium]
MYIFITVLIFIVCVLLILIVLVQNSKGGGLSANFTGNTQTMGVRKTADFLEKATWTLAGVFFFLSVIIVYTIPKTEIETKSALEDKVQNVQPVNPIAQPTAPAAVPVEPVE